jgi:hypothetical protein
MGAELCGVLPGRVGAWHMQGLGLFSLTDRERVLPMGSLVPPGSPLPAISYPVLDGKTRVAGSAKYGEWEVTTWDPGGLHPTQDNFHMCIAGSAWK